MKETRAAVIHTAGSLYDGSASAYFRTGTPVPSGGTVALSGYHAYRSLLWVDGEALRQGIGTDQVKAIAVTMTSAGNSRESAAPCAVRLYRTDLTWDAAKKGHNSADTTRFDSGMTAGMPVNAHMPEYGETGLIGRGETITNSVFMTGEAAERLAEALIGGCAIGTWDLKSGSVFSDREAPYHVRYLQEISLTVLHEPARTGLPAPETVRAARSTAAAGGQVTLVIGCADRTGVESWGIGSRVLPDGAWSADEIVPAAETVQTAAGNAGETRQWRVRAIGAAGTGDYTEMTGSVRVLARPGTPQVSVKTRACMAEVTIEAESDAGGESRVLMMNGEALMDLGPGAGKVKTEVLLGEGVNRLSFVLKDARGGISEAAVIGAEGIHEQHPGREIRWKGIGSGQMGLTVTGTEGRPGAAESAENEAASGQGERREICVQMYSAVPENTLIRRWLHGSGWLSLEADGAWGTMAVLKKKQLYVPVNGQGGTEIRLSFDADPYDRRRTEAWVTGETFPITVVNGGDVPCRPVIRCRARGDAVVKCGDQALTVYGCDGETEIDAETMTVTNESGEWLLTDGSFPVLETGENVLQCEGLADLPRVMKREKRI